VQSSVNNTLLPVLVCAVIEQNKWTPLNVNNSNTPGLIMAGFVAYERKFIWPHFSIKMIGIGKYHDDVVTHLKTP
jgi:hypothetical protein